MRQPPPKNSLCVKWAGAHVELPMLDVGILRPIIGCAVCGLFRPVDENQWYCWECCSDDEDPVVWCDCLAGEVCRKGPCRQRAHDVKNCGFPGFYLATNNLASGRLELVLVS